MGLSFSGAGVPFAEKASWSYAGFNRFRGRLPLSTDENDPMIALLCHSDCDGELTAEECAAIAPRLREVVQEWVHDYDTEMALRLARHMEMCAEKRERLLFC